MALKKFDLVSDHRLVRRPIVNIEMIDARINAELTFRGPARRLDCRPRLGNLIVCGDANQPGAMKRGAVLDRPIWWTQQPRRRDAVPQSGFVAEPQAVPRYMISQRGESFTSEDTMLDYFVGLLRLARLGLLRLMRELTQGHVQ